MAGSYKHVIDKNGGLGSNKHVNAMLENGGDVFEAVEEMYGMIWYLAKAVEMETFGTKIDLEVLVEEARRRYKDGLIISPTERYK